MTRFRNPFISRPHQSAKLHLFDLKDLNRKPRNENEALIRSLCANAYLGGDTALCRVLGRYKMYVDTSDISISSHLLLDGFWEMWVTEALAQIVRPGMTVVDIGANLGYFTLLLADLCGPEGKVHAFEPNPAIARRLAMSCTVNGLDHRVAVHQTALGDDSSTNFQLFVPVNHPGGAYIQLADADTAEGAHLITLRRLDSYPELAEADVFKIDAEAAEEAILRGMTGILERGRPMTILLEFAACRYSDPGRFLDEISGYGFALGYVDAKKGVRATTKKCVLGWSPYEDNMLVLTRYLPVQAACI